MRINLSSLVKTQETADAAQTAPGSRAASGATGSATATTDKAVLSPDQARVQSLAAEVNQLPDIRQEKVAALGRAVQQGNYNVSPEQTAEALIGELQARFAA
jgi:negative regulator of flagellin synthesis FlgM